MAANDNWSSATILTGNAGAQPGDNRNATFEVGEPLPEGRKTVWYRWTMPGQFGGYRKTMYFSTRYVEGQTNPEIPLATIVRVFQGTTLKNLQEVAYFPPPPALPQHRRWSGWETGSQIQFTATNLQTYYIRVDGFAGAEGDFLLSWGQYRNPILNACTSLRLKRGVGEICQSYLTVGDVTTPHFVQDFPAPGASAGPGTYGPGSYIVRYQRGAWVSYTPALQWCGVCISILAGQEYQTFDILNSAGVRHRMPPPPGGPWDKSYVEAEYGSFCNFIRLQQTASGLIQLEFNDQPLANLNAQTVDPTYTNPVLALFRVLPVFVQSGVYAARPVLGVNRIEGHFGVFNLTDANFPGVPVTLLEQGNIASVEGPLTMDFNALSRTEVGNFFFAIAPDGNTSAIATLRFNNGGVDAFTDLSYDLTPIISPVVLYVATNVNCGGNTAGRTRRVGMAIFNKGFYHTLNLQVTLTVGNGADEIRNDSCVVNATFAFGYVPGGGISSVPFNFRLVTPVGVAQTTRVRMHFTDGPVDHGILEINV